MPRTGWYTWLGTKDRAGPRSTLTAHLQLMCHSPCGKMTRRQKYMWLRNISSKYRIKANSECCHSCAMIALHFSGGIVKYFKQPMEPMEMKENERRITEGPGR